MLRKRQGELLGFPGPESLCCHILGFLPHLPLERDAGQVGSWKEGLGTCLSLQWQVNAEELGWGLAL